MVNSPSKKRNQVALNMWVSPELRKKFTEICEREGRKFNEQFRRIIEEWLSDREAERKGSEIPPYRDRVSSSTERNREPAIEEAEAGNLSPPAQYDPLTRKKAGSGEGFGLYRRK